MQTRQRKFFICLLFLLLFMITLVCGTGCQKHSDEPSDNTDSKTAGESESGIPSENPIASTVIRHAKLGLFGCEFETDHAEIAHAVARAQKDGVQILAFHPGVANITVRDWWGNEATVKVTVNGEHDMEVEVKAFADENSVNVRLFGASGNGVTDDTASIQAAIDSLKNGGTVYFPAGTYPITQLILRENISLMLEGRVENVADGYTKELAKRVENGEFAILKNRLYKSNLILNHDPSGSGANGASNISIIGGMIDLNGSIASGEQIDTKMEGPQDKSGGNSTGTCALVFSCAKNFLVQNVIFKDSYNGHAMQLTGAEDMKVIDCMFAGFTARSEVKNSKVNITLTRETIQVEYAHSGAIPPSSFEAGEYYYCKNTEIRGCYFGKSDKSGYHLIPIGQHGQCKYPNVTGIEICDNVFDNPYYCAIRFAGMSQMKIEGNRFISDRSDGYFDGAMIDMLCLDGNTTYAGTTKNGIPTNIIYSYGYEKEGINSISVKNNEFNITGSSSKRLIRAVSTSYIPGAITASQVVRPIENSRLGAMYTGYIYVDNVIRNIEFCENDIKIGKVKYTDYFALFTGIRNLTISDNKVTSLTSFTNTYAGMSGVSASNILNGNDAKTIQFGTDQTTVYAILQTTDGEKIQYRSDKAGTVRKLTLNATEGVERFDYQLDNSGNVVVTVICKAGYRFSGWKQGTASYSATGTVTMNGDLTLTAICEKNA